MDAEEFAILYLGWTNQPKAAPWPFRMDSTALYFLYVVFICCANLESQFFLLGRGFWRYMWQVVRRGLATVVLALASTLLYEHLLNWTESMRLLGLVHMNLRLIDWIGRRWGIHLDIAWAEDQGLFPGDILAEKRSILGQDPSFLRLPFVIYDAVSGLNDTVLICLCMCAYDTLWHLASAALLFSAKRIGRQDVVAYIEQDKIWIDYSPEADAEAAAAGEPGSAARLLGQLALQIAATVAILLVYFLHLFRVQTAREIDHDEDEEYEARNRGNRWRATAVHLYLYTAYQAFRYLSEAVTWELPEGVEYPPRIDWALWLFRFRSNALTALDCVSVAEQLLHNAIFSIGMMWAMFVIYTLLGRAVAALTRLGWWLSEPIYAWRTPWLPASIQKARTIYLKQVDTDFGMNEQAGFRLWLYYFFGDAGPLATFLSGAEIELVRWW